MTGSLEHNLRLLADRGLMLSIWATTRGFQANVAEQSRKAWTTHTDADPLVALNEAIRQRLVSLQCRDILYDPEPEQIDIEDAISDSIAAENAGQLSLSYTERNENNTPTESDDEDLIG